MDFELRVNIWPEMHENWLEYPFFMIDQVPSRHILNKQDPEVEQILYSNDKISPATIILPLTLSPGI